MEATQVKPETTVAPPEGPGKKSPQLTPPKKKRKWVKRLVILLVIAALLVLALALWCTLGVSAEDTTTTASGTAGSFQLEQVYVNAPELDVYFYATDANGESYSPIVVQAQGVEATLGDRKLDTGMIGVADDPICYIIALDNSTSIDAEDFHKMRTAIWKLAQTKQDKDQIMVYTLAGGAQCALPATNDKAEIFNTLRTIGQSEGAIDLTGTVTMLAADIQTEYQSLAPRKVAFVCTCLLYTSPSPRDCS